MQRRDSQESTASIGSVKSLVQEALETALAGEAEKRDDILSELEQVQRQLQELKTARETERKSTVMRELSDLRNELHDLKTANSLQLGAS